MPFERILFKDYEIPADLTYGRFLDTQNILGFCATSGSSTTTTAVETSGLGSVPFAPVAVGDWLLQTDSTTTQTFRRVDTKTSNTSIVVNSAWNLGASGKPLKHLPFRSGTTSTDGQVFIGSFKHATISYNLSTLTSTTVRLVVEVRMANQSAWTTLFDVSLSAAGSDSFTITEPWDFVRLGVEETSGGTTGDVFNAVLVADDNVFA